MQGDDFDAEQEIHQRERWERAITLSILAVIGSGILGVAVFQRYFLQPRCTLSPHTVCYGHLRALEGVKATWALENRITNNAAPTDSDLFGVDKYLREKPVCPAGGLYVLGALDQKPRCLVAGHTL